MAETCSQLVNRPLKLERCAPAPHPLAVTQCERPARKPTRPASAMMAQRTPRACSRIACISSTLADMRSKLGLHVRDLLLENGKPLALRTARGHGRLQIVRAIFSSERP